MDLSVIVLTWNSEKYAQRCLASVLHSLELSRLDYQVDVVDNGSTDGTRLVLEGLASLHPRLALQFLPENLGTTLPRNLALKRARGRNICILDSDVEVGEGVFTDLIRYLESHPDVGLVVPRIRYPSGLIQKSCDSFPTLQRKLNRLLRLRAIEARESPSQEEVTGTFPVDYAISAFWLFPSRLLDRVGMLDERIFYSPEDVDFCIRVWRQGYQIHCVPTVAVVHHTQEISRGWRLNKAKISHVRGLAYLFVKHRYLFKAPRFRREY
ncbi:glycosyltransferase family 2 protein [Geomonas subterranea]|uniref:glycosyltransferase family 2 protein n=1 Tax=Geomonas subterranea TaxID=2847989 RepID=UPI001CD2BE3C|nr:glycosyltransferase family 2 protein [Geomonas fuzhouensis]